MPLSFKKQLDDEMKAIGRKASLAITSSAKGAWKTAVAATPRDTGTAQAGWKLSTNRRASYVPVRRKQPKPTVPKFNYRITKDKAFYLFNNVDYIEILEKGGKNNRPHKMLARAEKFFESDLQRRFNAIK